MSETRAKLMQIRSLLSQGKIEQARVALVRALSRYPNDPDLNADMARALLVSGQSEQAVFYARRADAARPNHPATLSLLGGALMGASRPAEADPVLARAIELEPSLQDALIGRVNVLLALDRSREAADLARAALAFHADDPHLLRGLAYGLLSSARCDEAAEALRRAVKAHPGDILLASALATTLNYCPGVTPRESLDAHTAQARLLRAARPGAGTPVTAGPRASGPDRPLLLGIISPDLRLHPVAFFLEPLLERLDRAAFRVICYSNSVEEDAVTARLRALSADWRACALLTDALLAAKVRADRIDILLDLAGLTNGGRLGVFMQRPAPVQATWLGYPATTGLSEIDYRFVDSLTDPPGGGKYTTESLVRLDPCFLSYRPPGDAPPCHRSPGGPDFDAAAHAAPVTFGSFNAIQKLNTHLIGVWARLLATVPGSRLVLKTTQFADEHIRRDVLDRFAAAGAAPDRIDLLGRSPDSRSHLAQYENIDVALDPFPYNGTTTTCDALYMGVPVVTLAGPPGQHQGRVGVSLLTTTGLADCIAASESDYIRLAAALAADPARRSQLRASLRARVLASPLCDAPGFACRFGEALGKVWRDACLRGS